MACPTMGPSPGGRSLLMQGAGQKGARKTRRFGAGPQSASFGVPPHVRLAFGGSRKRMKEASGRELRRAITRVAAWREVSWLRAGTTQRHRTDREWRPGRFSPRQLRRVDPGAEWPSARLGRQIHGKIVHASRAAPLGVSFSPDGDGHVTDQPGVLLLVALADCVPVFLADERTRAVGLLHAGWRGAAAGIVREGVARMRTAFAARPREILAHLGPAICGSCYEVGPEAREAVLGTSFSAAGLLDLRAALRRQLAQAGLSGERISTSAECTLCGPRRYYSHRGGDQGRHFAFIGVRESSRQPPRGARS